MSPTILRSWQDWLVIGVVAAAAFVYFTAGSIVLAVMADAVALHTAASVAIRLVLAIIIAAVMLASERRRERPSVDAAVVEGIQIAAVVVITYNLFGATDMGARLAVRTALVLIGLPLLAVLTHLLARRATDRTSADGS